jgi:hypothetical protein
MNSAKLASLQSDLSVITELVKQMTGSAKGAMFPVDLLAIAAAKRCFSTTQAFTLLLESENITCSRAILRTHLDTALRFSAAWLVAEPHAFATEVICGGRIDKLKCKDGKKLTDAYLVQVRGLEHNWIPEVYKNLSGNIHFSADHLYSAIVGVDDDARSFAFEITDKDSKFPSESWDEMIDCCRAITRIIIDYLSGWIDTKQNKP